MFYTANLDILLLYLPFFKHVFEKLSIYHSKVVVGENMFHLKLNITGINFVSIKKLRREMDNLFNSQKVFFIFTILKDIATFG